MIHYKSDAFEIRVDIEKRAITSLAIRGKELILSDNILPLFAIQCRDNAGEKVKTDAYNAAKVEETKVKDGVDIRFYEFGDIDIEVIAHIRFSEQILWRIDITNRTQYVIEWIDFPQIAVPNDLVGAGGKAKILWGFNEGVVVDNLEIREKMSWIRYVEPDYPGEGIMGIFPAIVQTQFMAYYDNSCGLYLGTHDRAGNVKGIDFFSYNDGIKLQFRHFTGAMRGADFSMDYDFVMDNFCGDWYDACEIYRKWFETERASEFLPIEDNPKIPDWYKDSPIVITYPVRGTHDTDEMLPNRMFPYINGLKAVDRLAEKLSGRIMVLLMHWEGTAPWAPPYVWPPYGGEEALKQYVNALHEKGHLIGVYCSGIGWTQKSNVAEYNMEDVFEKDKLVDYMCASPSGEVLLSKVCTAQRVGYDMCPAQSFTVKTVADEVQKIVDADIDYIQVLDQNHGGTSYFCYGEKHNHPPVPGRWQTTAMRDLLTEVEKSTQDNGRKVLLGCESAAAETYIPQLLFSDNRFELNFVIGTPVPAYSYVYHTYVNNFMGNQVCAHEFIDHKKSPHNIMYRICHSFIAGDMLTLVLDQDGIIQWNWGKVDGIEPPDEKEVIELVKNLNGWRKEYSQYLNTGKMIKPLKVEAKTKEEMHLKCGYVHHYDRLLTSAWEAADGSIAQFVANYNDYETEFVIRTDKDLMVVKTPDGMGTEYIKAVDGKVCVKIQPLCAVMIREGEM